MEVLEYITITVKENMIVLTVLSLTLTIGLHIIVHFYLKKRLPIKADRKKFIEDADVNDALRWSLYPLAAIFGFTVVDLAKATSTIFLILATVNLVVALIVSILSISMLAVSLEKADFQYRSKIYKKKLATILDELSNKEKKEKSS
jgi:hypothetical protein